MKQMGKEEVDSNEYKFGRMNCRNLIRAAKWRKEKSIVSRAEGNKKERVFKITLEVKDILAMALMHYWCQWWNS